MLVIVIILFLGMNQCGTETSFSRANYFSSSLAADSIRAMTKYGSETDSMTLDSKLDHRYKECRGQRNFYITGFSLFLML